MESAPALPSVTAKPTHTCRLAPGPGRGCRASFLHPREQGLSPGPRSSGEPRVAVLDVQGRRCPWKTWHHLDTAGSLFPPWALSGGPFSATSKHIQNLAAALSALQCWAAPPASLHLASSLSLLCLDAPFHSSRLTQRTGHPCCEPGPAPSLTAFTVPAPATCPSGTPGRGPGSTSSQQPQSPHFPGSLLKSSASPEALADLLSGDPNPYAWSPGPPSRSPDPAACSLCGAAPAAPLPLLWREASPLTPAFHKGATSIPRPGQAQSRCSLSAG